MNIGNAARIPEIMRPRTSVLRVGIDAGAEQGACVRVLIAIPVYNERQYVRQVLEKVRQFHREILVIDDGSTDGTCKILGEVACGSDIHVIRHASNGGYGQSLIDAFAYADAHRYDWVITMDCDEQHEPEMIPKFIRQ